jgi:phosphoglycolate phosphatase-like HAD superfamily hydrolase
LVDSTYHHAMCWHRAFTRLGHDITVNRLHRLIGMGGDRLVAAAAGGDVEESDGDALRDAWAEEYADVADDVRPVPGAADAVRRLVDAGYVVALASSGEKKFAEKAVDDLGIADVVTEMTTSTDADESKPHPELVETTWDRVREEHGSERALLVGDTPYDVESAHRAGIPCIAVLTGGFGEGELEGADAVVEDMSDVTPELVARVLRG